MIVELAFLACFFGLLFFEGRPAGRPAGLLYCYALISFISYAFLRFISCACASFMCAVEVREKSRLKGDPALNQEVRWEKEASCQSSLRVGRPAGGSLNRSAGRSIGRSVDRLVGPSIGRSIGRSVGRSVDGGR